MNVVGLSAYYHESSCCLLRDGRLVAAASEERFSRLKHDPRIPLEAFAFCLKAGGIDIGDVDRLGYYESPVKKLSRQLWSGDPADAPPGLPWLDALRPEREIREVLGYEGPIDVFEHHQSHAASAFFFSGFDEAAVFTVDGVGEWATTSYGRGRGAELTLFEEVEFPDSLGLFYSTITGFLGFRVNSAEYKVMGLAPYGQPRHLDKLRQVLRSGPGGQYSLDLQYFDFLRGSRMHSDRLAELLGGRPRMPETELTQFHKDVARSAQALLEEVLLEKVRYLKGRVDSPNLCLAGGVALNCVANARILREGPYQRLFVQPAAGDAGGCVGAAALAYAQASGRRPSATRMEHAFLGPAWGTASVARQLALAGVEARDFRGDEARLLEAVVDRLVEGQVVAWFHGPMEFGPRALGARSILADPRLPGMRDRLNRSVKKRESFRPFAPSVLAAQAGQHFELDHASEFMLETCPVRSPLDLPAVTHVDGSARPQTVDPRTAPRFAALIEAFRRRTGCPLLVNTSFNLRGEPIVCSPADALTCMADSDIDALALEDFIVDRRGLRRELRELLLYRKALMGRKTVQALARGRAGRKEAVSSAVYTFI